MQVSDVMTKDVYVIPSDTSVFEAARIMRDGDVGSLPVQENDRLIGMITDRDIVVRGLADREADLDMPVRKLVTDKVLYCFDDQDVEEVLNNMGDQQVRRLPVLNREKRLVGIVSLANLARGAKSDGFDRAYKEITEDNSP